MGAMHAARGASSLQHAQRLKADCTHPHGAGGRGAARGPLRERKAGPCRTLGNSQRWSDRPGIASERPRWLAARFETCASHQHLRCCMLSSASTGGVLPPSTDPLSHMVQRLLPVASTNKLLRTPRRTFSSHLSRPHATRGHPSRIRRPITARLRQGCAARHGHAWLQDPSESGSWCLGNQLRWTGEVGQKPAGTTMLAPISRCGRP
jgi:hypothetical protein